MEQKAVRDYHKIAQLARNRGKQNTYCFWEDD